MPRQVSGSRSEWQADDGAMGGRAIFNILGILIVPPKDIGGAQEC
jgi:hypothetical protein